MLQEADKVRKSRQITRSPI